MNLTSNEKAVLTRILKGLTFREIAAELKISHVMVVKYKTDPDFDVSEPKLVFEKEMITTNDMDWGRQYDLAPDGKRFLILLDEFQNRGSTEIKVVLNWFEELQEKMVSVE